VYEYPIKMEKGSLKRKWRGAQGGWKPSLSQPLHVIAPVNFNKWQVNGGTVKKIFTADTTGCISDFYVVADDVVLQIGVYLVFFNITLYSRRSLCALINVLKSSTFWFPYYWALWNYMFLIAIMLSIYGTQVPCCATENYGTIPWVVQQRRMNSIQ
jgi:hypothetical protein